MVNWPSDPLIVGHSGLKSHVRATHLGCVSSQRRSRFEPATWSLVTFVRSHRSLCSLALQHSALLHSHCLLAPFTGSLTHFAHSLMGQLKFLNMCSRCYRVSREQMRFGRCRASERSERCERTNMASDRVAFSKRDCLWLETHPRRWFSRRPKTAISRFITG